MTITTEEAEALAERMTKHVRDRNGPVLKNGAWAMMLEAGEALCTLSSERDIANEQVYGLAEERERWKERAEAAEAETERMREAFRAEREENLWNAFNIGSIRSDGKWIDCGLSDAEWLVRELGLDQDANGYDPEKIKRRISEAAAHAALDVGDGTKINITKKEI